MIYGHGCRLALAPEGIERTMIFKRTAGRARLMLLAAPMAAVSLLVSGCMSEKDLDLTSYVEDIEPADTLYNQGLANLEAGRLKEAVAKFQAIDRQHPYSEFGRKALVMTAFAQYRQGNYEDSVANASRFVNLYPSHADAAYAQYIIGLCWFRQIRDVTQDQKEARRTVDAMDEVITRWPESQYVEDAKAKKRFARDQLAGKEMQIGRYYLERREYIASVKRFRYVVEVYSDTRHVEEALARLTETYYAMGLTSEAQTAAAVLGHNYPDSPWYRDSYKLLQTGGLEPRENRGSWISKAGALLVGT
jgi:outer membrane protein assembly factor BamD